MTQSNASPARFLSVMFLLYLLAGCGPDLDSSAGDNGAPGTAETPASTAEQAADDPVVAEPADRSAPVDDFMRAIGAHCGEAFAGQIVANEPPQDDDPFAEKPLVMHVRECTPSEIRIPFHVGEDRSRTWILTRTEAGLRLKHDHRHADGSEDAVTRYGGHTASSGTAQRQEFPVDEESIEMFEGEGLDASVNNVWAMEIEPHQTFVYELARPGGRLFRVEFDLTERIPPPQAPWGYE